MVFMQNFGGRGVPAERCCSECNNGKPEDCEKRFTHVCIYIYRKCLYKWMEIVVDYVS